MTNYGFSAGSATTAVGSTSTTSHTSGGKTLLDLELAYTFERGITFAIGGHNVFNTYPDENPIALYVGERYSEYSPFGFNGAYYYARLSYSFGSAFK